MNILGGFSSRLTCLALCVALVLPVTAVTGASPSIAADDARCAGKPSAVVTADQLEGDWTGDNGEHVQISPASPKDMRNFHLKSQHDWKGLFDGATLTFRRTPTAAEMSPVAPIWARLAVLGKIEWKLVLKPRQDCGVVLEGDWFPGELKFREVESAGGKIASETASVIGIGAPIHLVFRKSAPSHLFLYAVTTHGLQSIDALYPGVATIVEIQFDKPSAAKQWPVTVALAHNKLALVARQNDLMGYIFRTDAFVLRSGMVSKDQAFDPPRAGVRH